MNDPAALSGNAVILVVDDEPTEAAHCEEALKGLGRIEVETRSERAALRLQEGGVDLLITDLKMPRLDGLDLLHVAMEGDPELPVVVLTGYATVESAVDAMRKGAADYVAKPVHPDELRLTAQRLLNERRLQSENRLLRRRMGTEAADDEIVGEAPCMLEMLTEVRNFADSDIDVLITGETGTGKELVARMLHRVSPRAGGPFVPVDCGALPEHLMESEFFGHERGAFTGAHARAVGLMEFADHGTLFLDEVGSLPAALQAKLLRALQTRSFRRVGSTREVRVDLRVVAATNRPLEEMVTEGTFREDLYYRLNVGRIHVPPLRERTSDVESLAEYFLSRGSGGRPDAPARFSSRAVLLLEQYEWPGNVRELENVVRRCAATVRARVIEAHHLPAPIRLSAELAAPAAGSTLPELRASLVDRFERSYLTDLLTRHRGGVDAAAEEAGVPRGSLYRLLKKHGLRAKDFRVS